MEVKKMYLFIILIFSYILFINFLDYKIQTLPMIDEQNLDDFNQEIIGTKQQFGFSQSVDIKITRPRIYGIIIEQNQNKILYLFNLIPLPLVSNNISLIKFHLIFVVFLVLFLRFKKNKEKKIYKQEVIYDRIDFGDIKKEMELSITN